MEKNIVIIGGSSGIGKACVEKCLDQANIINIDRQPLIIDHANYHYIKADVIDASSLQQATETIQQQVHGLHGIVYSAGIHLSAKMTDTSQQQLETLLHVNLLGCWNILQQLLPLMISTEGDKSVVLIGSDQSLVAKPNSAAYGMTKSALAYLAKSIAVDYAEHGIRANCVCPGTIDTPLYQQAIARYADQHQISLKAIEHNEATQQLVNRIGRPEEVAAVVNLLLSEQVRFVTGALWPVDGGYTTI